MPNHKSAEKRVRQNAKRRARNRQEMSVIRTATKKVHAAIDAKDIDAQIATFPVAIRTLSRAAARGFIHKNTAARKISRLAKVVYAAQVTKVEA